MDLRFSLKLPQIIKGQNSSAHKVASQVAIAHLSYLTEIILWE